MNEILQEVFGIWYLIGAAFVFFMQYIKNSTFMNFLRRNAKATAKCSRPCEIL